MPRENGCAATHPTDRAVFQEALYELVQIDREIEDLLSKECEIEARLSILANHRVLASADTLRVYTAAGKPTCSIPVLDRHVVIECGTVRTRPIVRSEDLHAAAIRHKADLAPCMPQDGFGDVPHHAGVEERVLVEIDD